MISTLGFLAHTACVLAVAGTSCAVSYWLIGRLVGTAAAEVPDAARSRLNDHPVDRED